VTSHAAILEIEGLFTQESRPGRTVGESIGGIREMDRSDWSNGIRYHIFYTRPDTECKGQGFKLRWMTWRATSGFRPEVEAAGAVLGRLGERDGKRADAGRRAEAAREEVLLQEI